MLLLATIAILQMVFIPGYLLLKPFQLRGRLSQSLLIFAVSLSVNAQLVLVLTTLGWYQQPVLFGILALEASIIFWLRQRFPGLPSQSKQPDLQQQALISYLSLGFGVSSSLIIFYLLYQILPRNPGTFIGSDDLVSWNRWALDWASNKLPYKTWHYPQLIPQNWSLSYVITGVHDIHFFPKAIMALFPFAVLGILFDLYRRTHDVTWLVSLFITGYITRSFLGFAGEGFVDIPVTFMSLASIYALFLGFKKHLSPHAAILIGSVIFSGAALTKQTGLLMLPVFLLMSFKLYQESSLPKSVWLRSVALIILLVSPWFIYKEVQIQTGNAVSETEFISSERVHDGRSLSERIPHSFHSLVNTVFLVSYTLRVSEHPVTTYSVLALILLLLVASCSTKYGRYATLIACLFYIPWALFLSYDGRNYLLGAHFLAFALASGLVVLVQKLCPSLLSRGVTKPNRLIACESFIKKVLQAPLVLRASVVVSIVAVLILNASISEETIIQKHTEMLKHIGISEVNQRLYEFYENHRLDKKILHNYRTLEYLPVLKEHQSRHSFKDPVALQELFEGNQDKQEFEYILLQSRPRADVLKVLERYEASGRLERLVEQPKMLLYQISFVGP